MTSLVTEATESAIRSGTLESLTTTMGVVVVALVIILLAERELFRVFGGPAASARMRCVTIASVPLLMTTIAIVGARLASLA